jgi:hypothetical protein
MKRFNQYLIAFLLLGFSFSACKKDFFDINENPNSATETQITTELILPFALHNTAVQTALGYDPLHRWMGYWSPSGSFSPNAEESTYNITGNFMAGKWGGIADVLFDLHKAEEKARVANQPYYVAIAMIMKAHLFQNLVDMYGNVPYSQAFNMGDFSTPVYDKGEDIYRSLHAKLDTAVQIMKTATVPSTATTTDIVYKGNSALWIRLANTIKLRLLIRTSEITPNPTEELTKIKANGGVLQSNQTAAAQPGYINDIGKQSPFYGSFGLTVAGNQANEFNRANAYMIGLLRNSDDPRLSRFYKPAASPVSASVPYVGTVYGAPPNDQVNGSRTSNIGPGLAASAEQPAWIVTSVESMFLQAEAVARGWDIGSPFATAKAAYEAAVRESFIWLKAGASEAASITAANTYMTNYARANWNNAGTTTSSQVRFIVFQKYLALNGINALEAWSDYRRLGIPEDVPISIRPDKVSNTLPVRLLYPTGESAVNASAVSAQGSINPFTSTLFWDK